MTTLPSFSLSSYHFSEQGAKIARDETKNKTKTEQNYHGAGGVAILQDANRKNLASIETPPFEDGDCGEGDKREGKGEKDDQSQLFHQFRSFDLSPLFFFESRPSPNLLPPASCLLPCHFSNLMRSESRS